MVKLRNRRNKPEVHKTDATGIAVACRAMRFVARLSPLVLFAVLLFGCNGMNHNTTGGGATVDPLLGGAAIKAAVPVAPHAPASGPTASIPPVSPSGGSPASTAALAAGMTKPFDKDHDLRIAGPDNTGSEGWARQGTAQGTPTNGSGAVLSGVVPAGSPGAPQNGPTSVMPAANANGPQSGANAALRISSYDQAETLLKARGALWYGLEMLGDTGEWKFSCIVPNRQKPGSRRTYEARDRNKLIAVQAVLDQIDKDQQ